MSGLGRRLDAVRGRIEEACRQAGRQPADVTLVAVSKTVAAERVREALAQGQRIFGENRVQEALAKIPQVGGEARWHLVGHLQRNKARHATGAFELIQSIDGEELALEVDKRAARAGIVQPVLIQVHLGGETTKHGVSEDELAPLLDRIASLGHLDPRGLMTIPPPVERPDDNRRWFSRLRELRDSAVRRSGKPLPELSMGMTDDFEVAVAEGATLVRVGRAIFGERE